ncbi:MAG: outer membrane lipoprotein carrier protein LolA [Elusimicrobia bacterium]|nr:outer membrane lipoprotein carrier protein LolA [Elusimicrobiota bacterium]
MRQNLNSLAFFFVLLAASAAAAEKARKPAAKPQAQVQESTAAASVFLFPSSAPVNQETVLAHFKLYDRELASLSAGFTQSLTQPEAAISQSVEGTVDYLKPNRLRIRHVRPEPQLVVIDGKDIWIHRISQNQVIQSNLEEWKKADPAIGNLMRFGDFARMLEVYDAAVDTSAAQPALTLRPKTKGPQEFALRMTLNKANLFPEVTELTVGSLKVRTAFTGLRFNPALAEEAFRFAPPPGAEVFQDFKPPQMQ